MKSSLVGLIVGFVISVASAEENKSFETLCKSGNSDACNELGMGEANKANFAAAKKWFVKACQGGKSPSGCNNLATAELKLGNKAEAKRLFKQSCGSNDVRGCTKLGLLEIELGNFGNARAILNTSCDKGDNEACSMLSEMGKNGR